MEAMIHSGPTEPKPKDFPPIKDNPIANIGKVNVNRGKKPKKKKSNKLIRKSSGNGNYDRRHFTYGYASVASNRGRGQTTTHYADQHTGIAVVDEILQSMNLHKGDGTECESSEKQSDASPEMQDDVETSRDSTSPDAESEISPISDQKEEAKKHEQLVFAMNDFDEEEVYIRRNGSVETLSRFNSEALLTRGEPKSAQPPTPSEAATKPTEKPGWTLSGQPSSPATSPHRLNFFSANGLLQVNGDGRNAVEEQPMPSAVHRPYPGEMVMEEQTESGYQPAMTLHALLQMGSSNPSMTHLSHQMAAHFNPQIPLGHLQLSAMGRPPMQSLFGLSPHQAMIQGHPTVLNNVSNLSTHPGLHLGTLLGPDFRAIQPEPMRNGRDDIRKPRDEILEDPACFYMKPTNNLDRFLTAITPMVHLDLTLDPQKAQDMLTLVSSLQKSIPTQIMIAQEDVWKFYYDCSMLGREIPLLGGTSVKENHCGPSTAYYLPYLSGIQIFTPELCLSDGANVFLCDVDGWPPFMRMQYEQFENNPPWFRLPLYDLMDGLSMERPELKQLKLKDLHPASWFCVAWYPLYRIPDAPLGTRFLTFHSFHPSVVATTTFGRSGAVPLVVHGLEWYNMSDEIWLDNIKLTKPIRTPSPSKTPDHRPEGGDIKRCIIPTACLGPGEGIPGEHHQWMLRIKELRETAKMFARGLGFRRSTPHGIADANTHHHDFEYFYERN